VSVNIIGDDADIIAIVDPVQEITFRMDPRARRVTGASQRRARGIQQQRSIVSEKLARARSFVRKAVFDIKYRKVVSQEAATRSSYRTPIAARGPTERER